MISNNHQKEKGFTIIEMMIVVSIVGLLAAIALTTYFSSLDNIRLQGDVRALNGAMQQARLRAIATGIPHGIAFLRKDGDQTGNNPDTFFIFVDCVQDGVFTDDGNLSNNAPITDWDACSKLTQDPFMKGSAITRLSSGDYFTLILGGKNQSAAPPGAALECIVFNHLGQAVQGTTLVQGDIFLQNHRYRSGVVSRAGIHITGASGMTELIPMSTVSPDAWKS